MQLHRASRKLDLAMLPLIRSYTYDTQHISQFESI
jgi:hypothetical protein